MAILLEELEDLVHCFAYEPYVDWSSLRLIRRAIMAIRVREMDLITSIELDLLAEDFLTRDCPAVAELLQTTAWHLWHSPGYHLLKAHR